MEQSVMVKESGKQEWDSCSQWAESNDYYTQISFVFLFSSGLQYMDGAAHIQGWLSLFNYAFLETLCYTYPEVCCHGDSKSNQVDKMNHHTWKANLEMEKKYNENKQSVFLRDWIITIKFSWYICKVVAT